jgi:hypothetical protein
MGIFGEKSEILRNIIIINQKPVNRTYDIIIFHFFQTSNELSDFPNDK